MVAFLSGSTFEVDLLVAWRNNEETDGGGVFIRGQGDCSFWADGFVVKAEETDGGGSFLSGWGRAGFNLWWAESFIVGVSAGDLCWLDGAGVIMADVSGILAATLEYRCVMVFFQCVVEGNSWSDGEVMRKQMEVEVEVL